MGSLNVDGGGRGGRKSVDSEINMIPMIDLLMVTVSFLLITAVWSTMSRIDASAQTAGDPTAEPKDRPVESRVHVDVKDETHFTVSLRQGNAILESHDLEDHAVAIGTAKGGMRYEVLSHDLGTMWRQKGSHRAPNDADRDMLVLHSGDDVRYETLVRVMDAVDGVKREDGKNAAFRVTFASH